MAHSSNPTCSIRSSSLISPTFKATHFLGNKIINANQILAIGFMDEMLMMPSCTRGKGIGNNGGKILKQLPRRATSPKKINGKFVHYEYQKQN